MDLVRTNTFMVLRLLLLFMLTFSSVSYAQRSSKVYFKKAQIQFKKKRYSSSLKMLRKGYNFKKPSRIPASALFLIAYNYQKLRKYKEANYYFNRLIKNIYIKKHLRVIKAYKRNAVDDVELPKTLGMTYYNLGLNHYMLFRKKGSVQSALKARMYFKICDEVDIADDCSDKLEAVERAIKKAKLQRKRFEFYLQAGRLLFQDRVEIEENSSGIASSLNSNNAALCYGAGLRYGSSFKGLDFNGCIYSGTTTVNGAAASESGTDYDYKQSGVPIAGIQMEGGYYYRFDEQKARIGGYGILMYRAGSYSEPTGYTINDPTAFYIGASFLAALELPLVEFQTKIAHMTAGLDKASQINSLTLNVVYNF